MKKTGAQIVIHLLEEHGVPFVAGIPGGAILPLYRALGQSKLRHILTRHEQGAGFIAQGFSRATGRAGVCWATSGPGATNLLTAIADAKADSVPLVAITANVPQSLMGTDAFQEVDVFTMSLPITKYNLVVERAEDLFQRVPEAFRLAESPRRGPVLIDIPKDVLTAEVEFEVWPDSGGPEPWMLALPTTPEAPEMEWILEVEEALAQAKKPVVYAGGGAAHAWKSLRSWARREQIPVATTLMGLGIMAPGDPQWLGMLGMHGTPQANQALAESDLVVALGVRFDDRAVGKIEDFCPCARVIHVDHDGSELGKIHRVDWAWEGEVEEFLRALLQRPSARRKNRGLVPQAVLQTLAELAGPDALVTTDVGQHQMWAAQFFPLPRPGLFMTSGGLGTMGFGLPAAIGAALANPGRRTLCLTGDGSLMMNVQELATMAELRLPILILVFHNGGLGLVRQQQDLFYGAQRVASDLGSNPDFPALAKAFGVAGERVNEWGDLAGILERALAMDGPMLVEVPVSPRQGAFPMVPPGMANVDALMTFENKEEIHGTV